MRAAGPNSPVNDDVCHPFKWEDVLFMHNGMLADFSFGGAMQ